VELAQKHGCKYFETSAIRNDQVPEAFSSLIARIVAQIPNPPEPSLLLRKRIQSTRDVAIRRPHLWLPLLPHDGPCFRARGAVGKSLAENKSFRAALFDMA
jgi:hypothetical protein